MLRRGDVAVRGALAPLAAASVAPTAGLLAVAGIRWCQVLVLPADLWPRASGEVARGGEGLVEGQVERPPTEAGTASLLGKRRGSCINVGTVGLELEPEEGMTMRGCDDCTTVCALAGFHCSALGVVVRGGEARAVGAPATMVRTGDFALDGATKEPPPG